MRVGGDGDFCSREHRNQFRLRKGMDRLMEANKVASLMRRRENPKQIPLARLINSSTMEPRPGCATAAFNTARRNLLLPQRPIVLARTGVAGTGRILRLQATKAAGQSRMDSAELVQFSKRRPSLPEHSISKSAVRLAPAGAAKPGSAAKASNQGPRECGAVLRASRGATNGLSHRVAGWGGRARLAAGFREEPRAPLRQTAAATRIAAAPSFPPHKAAASKISRRQKRSSGFASARVQPVHVHSVIVPAEIVMCAVRMREPAITAPVPSFQVAVCSVRRQDPKRVVSAAGSDWLPGPQVCRAPWMREPSADTLQLQIRGLGALPFPVRGAVRSPVAPSGASDAYRLQEVAFAPDSTFDYPARNLNGSLNLRQTAAPVRTEVPGLIEESFNSGLERWMGDTSGWRVDAAGAYPAGLALFQPSLTLRDSEVEFLARIEKRGLSFVIRASNLSNYHRISIGLSESGRHELRRSAVIGGIEEPAVVLPLGARLKAGAAFTVKARALRNDVAISVDGETVAQWTDGRLPLGGIGFTAGKNEQARIYWIRLTPAGGPQLEAASSRQSRSTS
jgi:hypothetical protein